MKHLNYLIVMTLSVVLWGCATTRTDHNHKSSVTVFEKELGSKDKISSEMWVNDLNRVHAHVFVKTPRRNGNCSTNINRWSKRCRVKTVEVPIKGISLEGNDIFFTANGVKTKCGFVKDKGSIGRIVILDKNCNIESSIVSRKVDDGVNINDTRFGVVTFNVEM